MKRESNIFTGCSLEEAVATGLDALGFDRRQACITVLTEGRRGFLGLGARPFSVQITRRKRSGKSKRPAFSLTSTSASPWRAPRPLMNHAFLGGVLGIRQP
jgi:predicted RNA-binding protein Jag